MPKVYEELIEFIARLSPQRLSIFSRQRLRENGWRLSVPPPRSPAHSEEEEELENYLVLDHLFAWQKRMV